MFTEARITAGLDAMLRQINAPPPPVRQIRERAARKRFVSRQRGRIFWPATAAAAALILVLAAPAVAPGFVQSVEAQIEAILHWKPPPPAPKTVWSAMRPVTVTLAEAQARVPFRIVPPTGLPHDVRAQKIYAGSPGVFSEATHSWSLGTPYVNFVYRRADGRSFSLMATRYAARGEPPSKYMFEDMDRKAHGREVILRRDRFTWRNGDQVMTAIADEGIDATEIVAIRSAMRGTEIPGVYRPPQHDGTVTQIRIP
ncbi:MAG: hypothetical protein WB757_01275 [Candidatus Cybelea sp.]|jgi:hypothetical protein